MITLVWLVLGVLLFAIVVWFVVGVWMLVYGMPYVPTPLSVCRTMVKLAQLKHGDIVFDLGAGDGRMLRMAKRDCPTVNAQGFEIVLPLVLLSRVLNLVSGVSIPMHWKDVRLVSLETATVFLLYVNPQYMRLLAPALREAHARGARIITHQFPVPGLSASRTQQLDPAKPHRCVYVYA